jgi:hypothetical protein
MHDWLLVPRWYLAVCSLLLANNISFLPAVNKYVIPYPAACLQYLFTSPLSNDDEFLFCARNGFNDARCVLYRSLDHFFANKNECSRQRESTS